jgi:hypothetical protein
VLRLELGEGKAILQLARNLSAASCQRGSPGAGWFSLLTDLAHFGSPQNFVHNHFGLLALCGSHESLVEALWKPKPDRCDVEVGDSIPWR